jgi:ABC-type transport system involved in multi-copper enzyme maturation permease subunit
MRAKASRIFRTLLGEAVHDAVRRRIVPAIAVVSLLSLMMVDGCTSCASPTIMQNGVAVELPEIAGWTGMVIFVVLALWTMVLAGILASDHLAEVLADGTAPLVLSRPVSRAGFALARLCGVLAIAFVTGLVLLGGSTALLVLRNGVSVAPAVWGALAAAAGATITASLAMTASLYLPRIATVMVVLVGIAAIATVNAIGLFGVELGGFVGLIDRFGPPLGSSVIAGVAAWIAPAQVPVDGLAVAIRAVAWAAAAMALLVVAFRSQDIGK